MEEESKKGFRPGAWLLDVDMSKVGMELDAAPDLNSKKPVTGFSKQGQEDKPRRLSWLSQVRKSNEMDIRDHGVDDEAWISALSRAMTNESKQNTTAGKRILDAMNTVGTEAMFMSKMVGGAGMSGEAVFGKAGKGPIESYLRSLISIGGAIPASAVGGAIGVGKWLGLKASAGIFGWGAGGDMNDALDMIEVFSSLPEKVILQHDEHKKAMAMLGHSLEAPGKVAEYLVDNIGSELERRDVVKNKEMQWKTNAVLKTAIEGAIWVMGPKALKKMPVAKVVGKVKKTSAYNKNYFVVRDKIKQAKANLEKIQETSTGARNLERRRAMRLKREEGRFETGFGELEAKIDTAAKGKVKNMFLNKRFDAALEILEKAKTEADVKRVFNKYFTDAEMASISDQPKLQFKLREMVRKESSVKDVKPREVEINRATSETPETIKDRPATLMDDTHAPKSSLNEIPIEQDHVKFKQARVQMGVEEGFQRANKIMDYRNRFAPKELSTKAPKTVDMSTMEYDNALEMARTLKSEAAAVDPKLMKILTAAEKKELKRKYKTGELNIDEVADLIDDGAFGAIDPKVLAKPAPKQGTKISKIEQKNRAALKKAYLKVNTGLSTKSARSMMDAMAVSNNALPGKMIAKGVDVVTLDMLGGQQAFENAVGRINALRELSMGLGESAIDFLSTEAPYKRLGAPSTGYAYKVMPSVQAAYEEQGLMFAKRFAKKMRKANAKDNGKDIVLSAENEAYFKRLPSDVQAKIKPLVKEFREFFAEHKKIYKDKFGIEVDWKKRMVNDINKLMETDISLADRQALTATLKNMESMNYVHIPVFWLEALMEGSKSGMNSLNPFVLKVLKKRKNFSIAKLVEEIGPDFANQVHPSEIMASYMRRMGKDAAVVNLLRAAEKDGLVKIFKKGRKLTEAQRKKRGITAAEALNEEMSVLESGLRELKKGKQYRKLNDNVFSFVEGEKWAHEVLADGIESMLKYGDETLRWWGKAAATVKMMQFFNPFIMPMYDVVQSGLMMAGDMVIPTRWPKMAKAFRDGFRDSTKRNKNYYKAQLDGLSSVPFNNPMANWRQMAMHARMSNMDLLGESATNALRTGGLSLVKQAYNLSWNLAWRMDRSIRMVSYNYLKSIGMSSKQAAKTAALYHGDYASVPAGTRRMLNYLFFTPTFKIAMGKLYYKMARDAVKSVTKFGRVDKMQKARAKGIIGVLAVNQLMDSIMINTGAERVEWGRKYIYRNVRDPETGQVKDLVNTFSNPANITTRYISRTVNSIKNVKEDPSKSFIGEIIRANRNEVTPMVNIFLKTFYDNQDWNGNPISSPFDSVEKQGLDKLEYIARNVFKMSDLILPDSGNPAKVAYAKRFGELSEKLTSVIMFKYMRQTESRAKRWRLQRLNKLWRQHTRAKIMTGKRISREERARFLKLLRKISEDAHE